MKQTKVCYKFLESWVQDTLWAIDEDPSLGIESSAMVTLRGVSTNVNK